MPPSPKVSENSLCLQLTIIAGLRRTGRRVHSAAVSSTTQTGSASTTGDDSTPQRPVFVTTRWTVVLTAGRSRSADARGALEKLCRTYWHPIYAFVRRRGYSAEDAQDLTQEFFARLLEKKWLDGVDPVKGRFRSFLLASVKHFLANEWDKARAQKRGGGQTLIPIDVKTAETSCGFEPVDNVTAEKIFERRWALTILGQVLAQLRAEFVADGKTELFETLKGFLTGADDEQSYAEVGAKLRMSAGAIKVAVHRLRRRYRNLLREEIANTVASPEEVDEEIRALFAAFVA